MGRQVRQHPSQVFRVRPRAEDALLRASKSRRRDGLHGLRELLRVLDGPDAAPNV